jgi:hypothetical protein
MAECKLVSSEKEQMTTSYKGEKQKYRLLADNV